MAGHLLHPRWRRRRRGCRSMNRPGRPGLFPHEKGHQGQADAHNEDASTHHGYDDPNPSSDARWTRISLPCNRLQISIPGSEIVIMYVVRMHQQKAIVLISIGCVKPLLARKRRPSCRGRSSNRSTSSGQEAADERPVVLAATQVVAHLELFVVDCATPILVHVVEGFQCIHLRLACVPQKRPAVRRNGQGSITPSSPQCFLVRVSVAQSSTVPCSYSIGPAVAVQLLHLPCHQIAIVVGVKPMEAFLPASPRSTTRPTCPEAAPHEEGDAFTHSRLLNMAIVHAPPEGLLIRMLLLQKV
mmetsp:Transcript_46924/g.84801  ORF Transcript_46924/g.84801 Transcript_46924/m.84801 type:complete len:300 (-) Transcript_46924:1731-2630(-)